jgi:hypothetical protein
MRNCSYSDRSLNLIQAVADQSNVIVRIDEQAFDTRRTISPDVMGANGNIFHPPDVLTKGEVEYRISGKDWNPVSRCETDFHRSGLAYVPVRGHEPNEIGRSY